MSRPSLVGGSIRPGGDPNDRIQNNDDNFVSSVSRPSLVGGAIRPNEGPDQLLANNQNINNRFRRTLSLLDNNAPEYQRLYLNCKVVESEINKLKIRKKNAEVDALQTSLHLQNRNSEYDINRMTDKRISEAKEDLWEKIDRWMSVNPAKIDRFRAVSYQGYNNETVLHLICQMNPPLSIVETLLSCAIDFADEDENNLQNSEIIVSPESKNGYSPLHLAVGTGASLGVIKALAEFHPESKLAKDNHESTPLIWAITREGIKGTSDGEYKNQNNMAQKDTDTDPEQMATELIQCLVDPPTSTMLSAAAVPNKDKTLPIHVAFAHGTYTAVLEVLIKAHPEGVYAKNNFSLTPIQICFSNAHNDASPYMLSFVLSEKYESLQNVKENSHDFGSLIHINKLDKDNLSPLHQLSVFKSKELQSYQRENVIRCLELYLDSKPPASTDLLTVLQTIPVWLRDVAVTHTYIQKVINHKISRRTPTFLLLADGYWYIILISCFQMASIAHIRYRFDDKATDKPNTSITITFCILGATYFLIRELLQIISLVRLKNFQSWCTSSENFIDVLLIVLIFYLCGDMLKTVDIECSDASLLPEYYEDYTNGLIGKSACQSQTFTNMVAVTMMVLWLSFMLYLRNIMLDFAVFVQTVIFVTYNLVFFLLALAIILITFAISFHIIYSSSDVCNTNACQMTCNINGEDEKIQGEAFPHCSLWDSLIKVYSMMLGEIGEVNRYQHYLLAQILYVFFVLVVVILLSNVLIAIVTDTYSELKNLRAEMVFWSNRLHFVTEVNMITSMKQVFCNYSQSPNGKNDYKAVQNDMLSQEQRDIEANKNNYENISEVNNTMSIMWDKLIQTLKVDDHTETRGFLSRSLLRFIIKFFVRPLWFLMGVISCGWLWPPQIREYLLVARETMHTSQSDDSKQVVFKPYDLRAKMDSMKSSFKQEIELQKKEISVVKDEIKHVRNNISSDLNSMKQIMKVLFDVCKDQVNRREDVLNTT